MNKTIKVIALSLVILSAVSAGTAKAATASLSFFPTAVAKDAGSTFQVSLVANTPGAKICAVEGKLAFGSLTCQSIAVSSDVLAQTSPTCTNPYFLIGIPSCTISDKAVLSVSVKAENAAGTATISLTGVDIIDDNGKSISTDSIGGVYTIVAPVATPVKPPVTHTNPANPTPTPTPTATPAPTPEPTQQPLNPEIPQQPGASLIGGILSAIGGLWVMLKNFMIENVFYGVMLALLIILLILLIIYLIYLLFKKEDQDQNQPKQG